MDEGGGGDGDGETGDMEKGNVKMPNGVCVCVYSKCVYSIVVLGSVQAQGQVLAEGSYDGCGWCCRSKGSSRGVG